MKSISNKYIIMLIGLFLSALGVSFSMRSNLGATPVGVCPAVFSPAAGISVGMGMGVLLAIFFVAQILILKKDFHPSQFMQLVATLIYSAFIDITSNIVSFFPVDAFWQKILYCGLGILILATGVFIMLKAGTFMLPQDAFVKVICEKYNTKYGKVKIIFDSILTIIAASGSWILYKGFVQVGIGTIAGAVFVGLIIGRLRDFEGINVLLDRATGEI